MNTDNTLILAIIGHLVGDYLLQNDWMALNKKKHSFNCAIHCCIWAWAVCMFAGWYPWIDWKMAVIWQALFWSHYAQDRTNVIPWWMDLIGQKQFRTGMCSPWSIIVVDNVWHIVVIFLVWKVRGT